MTPWHNFTTMRIFNTVKNKNWSKVDEIIRNGLVNVDIKDKLGDTLLHCACFDGKDKIVELLMSNGADVNATNNQGSTPLHVACAQGNLNCARLLLSNNAYVNATNKNAMQTPLHWACSSSLGRVDVVQLLVSHGADYCMKDNIYGKSPIEYAQDHNHTAIVVYLTEQVKQQQQLKEPVRAPSNGGGPFVPTPPPRSGSFGSTQAPGGGGSFVPTPAPRSGSFGSTPASGSGSFGPTPAPGGGSFGPTPAPRSDSFGPTPAPRSDSFGSTPAPRSDSFGSTPAPAGGSFGPTPAPRSASFISTPAPAPGNQAFGFGGTGGGKQPQQPLHVACERGALDELKQFLIRGDNVEATNSSGCTPLLVACGGGHVKLVELLLSHGANVEAKNNNGSSPLHVASGKGYLHVVKLLLSHGANIGARTEKGNTALHSACRYGHLEVVQFLVSKGADATVTNKYNETPMQQAQKEGHITVVDFLMTFYSKKQSQQQQQPDQPSAFLSLVMDTRKTVNSRLSLIRLVRLLDELSTKIFNLNEIKLFCSLVMLLSPPNESMTQSAAPLEWQDAQEYIQGALEKAAFYCCDSESIANYENVLWYYKSRGIINEHEKNLLFNRAKVQRTENAHFLQTMNHEIQQNAALIQGLQGSVENIMENFNIVQSELHSFKSAKKHQRMIQGRVSIFCAALNVVTFNVADQFAQVFDCTFNSVVDISNPFHILDVLKNGGDMAVQSEFKPGQILGMDLAKSCIGEGGNQGADTRLQRELEKEPSRLRVLGIVCGFNMEVKMLSFGFNEAAATPIPQNPETPASKKSLKERVGAIEIDIFGEESNGSLSLQRRIESLEEELFESEMKLKLEECGINTQRIVEKG